MPVPDIEITPLGWVILIGLHIASLAILIAWLNIFLEE